MSTLEKCARAIQQVNEQNGGPPYDALPMIHRKAPYDDLFDQARAVITTLASNLDEKAVEAAMAGIHRKWDTVLYEYVARDFITAYLTTIAEQG